MIRAPWLAWGAGVLGLTVMYASVFALTDQLASHLDRWIWALCNAAPHVLLSIPLVYQAAPRLARLKAPLALCFWIASTVAYAVIAYGSVIFLLALTARVDASGLWVQFFQGPALSWQIFQAVAYAALSLTTGLLLQARRDLAVIQQPRPASAPSQPWLVKTAEGIIPIDPRELIRVEADGEYSRLVLPGRTILSRIKLGDCEARVVGLPFMRIHRSHLINGGAIVRAEPAGNGRLQLALRNGDSVITSRDGARLIRSAAM